MMAIPAILAPMNPAQAQKIFDWGDPTMIDKILSPIERVSSSQPGAQKSQNGQFAALFQQNLQEAAQKDRIAFSKHAMVRAQERGIEVDDTLLGQLSDSVEKAQAKGATNILAFDATRAFIVNIPHGRVITAMSQEEMKENIFTNIDGAVIL